MEQKYLEDKMHELEKIINYRFNDINLLCEAMNATKISENDYANEGLALVGDTILKFVLADKIFTEETKIKGEITKSKEKLEKNGVLYEIFVKENWRRFAYNNDNFYDKAPGNNKVSCKKEHNPYIEAIIAAIYYDSSFDNAKHWILYFLYPLLKKYSTI